MSRVFYSQKTWVNIKDKNIRDNVSNKIQNGYNYKAIKIFKKKLTTICKN